MALNHIYRLVWSEVLDAWIAVSEIVRTHGKRHGKVLRLALPLLMLPGYALGQSVPGTVVPAGSGTSAYFSANGVPVVNIRTANGAGLSHNQFLRYDVESKGLVLNNGNLSQVERQSQLAGRILANPNLVQPANIILNEVVTTNRSQLAGFTEVVGGQADVVIANPNGITCSGCGFINTDRATLTTGTPLIGTNGRLSGLAVERGDILVDKSGFNASAQQVLELVARSIKLEAPIVTSATGSLQMVTGANNWSYDTHNVTASIAGSGPVPGYAIDSSVVGGMYAGRIRLVATEAGVGVRMLGNAAASAGDFSIDTAGRITIQSQLSAGRDLSVSTSTTGADALSISGSTLAVGRNMNLAVGNGGTVFDSITGIVGGALRGSFGSLAVLATGKGTMLYGQTISLDSASDMHLGTAAIQSTGDLALSALNGSIDIDAGSGQGLQSTAGDISLVAGAGLRNAGAVSAGAGSLSMAGSMVRNSGVVHAANEIRISDTAGTGSESLENSGSILAGTRLSVNSATLANASTGVIQGGSSTTIASDGLSNQGKLILSTARSGNALIAVDTLANSGLVQTDGSATIQAATWIDNSGDMLGSGSFVFRGTDAGYRLDNTGRLQAGVLDIEGWNGSSGVDVFIGKQAVAMGGAVDIKASSLHVAGDAGGGGVVSSERGLSIDTGTLAVSGEKARIVGASAGQGTASIVVASALTNYGHIHSGHDLGLRTPGIVNAPSGAISAGHDLTIGDPGQTHGGPLLGNLTNSGALYAGHGLTIASTSTVTNESDGLKKILGTIDSGGTIDLLADTLVNHSSINAKGNITIAANTFVNGQDNRASSTTTPVTTSTETFDDYWFYNTTTTYYTSRWTVAEYFVGGKPSFTPQVISDATLKIADFTIGKNLGGLLSGDTVRIVSAKPGAQFDNVDLAIKTIDYTKTWTRVLDVYPFYFNISVSTPNTVPSAPRNTDSASAVINANLLDAGGFVLHNTSSTYPANPVGTAVSGASSINGFAVPGFPGLVLNVPTNPNGYFVPAANSNARYLIETNPLYLSGSSFGGSDYLFSGLGIDPETTQKRLGDANYEAYLIRQQVIQKTGTNLLNAAVAEAEQMKRLMDQAVSDSNELGLRIGKALTPEQLAGLKHDIVWMVEVTVGGERVLAPVVYLCMDTRNSIRSGAVIAAKDVRMDLASLKNTGGTIIGSNSLDVTTRDDLVNTSGVIKGGEVSLKSTEGSIVNQTSAEGQGGEHAYVTTVGKIGSIEAGGNLGMAAAQDIRILGADVKAGGAGTLTAGRDITIDTIVDKTTSTSRTTGSSNLLHQAGPSTTTTTTERNIGSSIVTGGNLNLKSGGDTTLAGSKAAVGGNLDVDSGGDFNILARQDKTMTRTATEKSGFGVGGGLWGSERTTTDDLVGKNFGSSVTVGGDAAIKAAKDMTLQGSDLTIGGAGKIDAGAVKILEGKDERRTITKTESQTFLSTGSTSGSSAAAAASAASGRGAASGDASASAGVNESSELNVLEKRTTTVDYSKTTGVGSRLTTGGDLDIKARETATVQGSSVDAGKDLSVEARKIEVLAGRNEEKTTTTTSASKVGIYTDSKADASAEAGASATGMSGSARAGASAKAEADSTATIGTRLEESSTQTTDITHTASSLKSGGDMSLKAREEARFVGAKVESTRDLNIEAKDITNLAAEDSRVTTSSSKTTTAGIYLSGEASAKAEAEAKGGAGLLGGSAKAEAEAGAEAGAGLRVAHEAKGSEQGSTTNVVSTFKAGRDIARQASSTITDQGTQLEAGRNIKQSATTIKEIVAENKTWSKESAEQHDARLGVYAGAGVKAGANAQAGALGKDAEAKAEAEASAGLKGKYTFEKSSTETSSASAVTSRYKAGGSITSTSTDKTTLIGTQFDAGKDVTIEAKSLDFQAARDTTSGSSGKQSAEAEAKVKLVGTAGAELSGAYDRSSSSSSSSTARAGGINAGGNVTVRTRDDARLEGTEIAAGEKAKVESTAGNVVFDAAKSTTNTQSQGFNVNAKVGLSKQTAKDGKASEKAGEGAVGGGYSQSSGSSTMSKGASIKGRDVEVSAARDVRMEGSQVKAAGDATVKAGGDVKLFEAKDSSKSSSLGVKANADLSKDAQSGGVNVKAATADKQTGKATSIQSGSNTSVSGKRVTSQEAELSSSGKTTVKGQVQNLKKTGVDTGMKLDIGADAVRKAKPASDAKGKSPDAKSSSASSTPEGKSATPSTSKDARSAVTATTPAKAKKKVRKPAVKTPAMSGPALSAPSGN